MAIYLGLPSPAASSDLPGSRRAALCFLLDLASDGVYTALSVTRQAVVSYTAFPPLPENPAWLRFPAVNFLLHFPWSRLHQTLSGILPCEARTFLSCGLSVSQQRPFALLSFPIVTQKTEFVYRFRRLYFSLQYLQR